MCVFILAGGILSPAPLRVGILPDADSLPLMVARDEGLFKREGVDVELVIFSNPQERDAAIQAGRIDGAISDILAAAFFAAGGFDTKITSRTDGRYGIVGAPASKIRDLSGLNGKRIGLSTNTIIQYTVDVLMEEAGLSYQAVSIPRMPVRMEMALSGQIEAAALPEPLLTAAVQRGGVLLAVTGTPGEGGNAGMINAGVIDAGVLIFSKKVLDTRLEDTRRFYRAYYKAALKINVNNDGYRDYLTREAGFPPEIRNAYKFVRYSKPALPAEAQINNALAWLEKRKLLEAKLKAADLTDGRAIAEW
jgi:NitT/TauT family transport system substrate-binding protein